MNWALQSKWFLLAVRKLRRSVWGRINDWCAVRMAQMARPATAFVSQPEPRSYGVANRGLQMLAGNYLLDGEVVQGSDASPWSLEQTGSEAQNELHGFGWLDDVVAVDTPGAHATAQAWVFDWIALYGKGRGAGWVSDLTGRRIIRWINHAVLILNHAEPEQSRAYFQSLGHQARFLMRRWKSMRPGLPRFEALTGLVYCGLALEGQGAMLSPALAALGRECAREIADDGGLESRNPEELMEIFTLLSWVNQAVSANGTPIGRDILRALERLAPAIRSLRLGDGAMVRFHGGGAGQAERVDQALADAGISIPARGEGVMGFSRLAAGSTVAIMDTGLLPKKGRSDTAHASTLAFEMSSGRVPVLVNMGSARGFESKLQSASRATAAHNAVVVAGTSLARFAGAGWVRKTLGQQLVDGPRKVTVERDSNEHGIAVIASHDGYGQSHGLVHTRQIAVLHDGNEIQGTEQFSAIKTGEKLRSGRKSVEPDAGHRLPFAVHFRAHPDVEVDLDLGGRAASLRLPNGEVWVLRCEGVTVVLEDTVYFEQGRLKPRATKQVVATGGVVDYEGGISWTLSRPT